MNSYSSKSADLSTVDAAQRLIAMVRKPIDFLTRRAKFWLACGIIAAGLAMGNNALAIKPVAIVSDGPVHPADPIKPVMTQPPGASQSSLQESPEDKKIRQEKEQDNMGHARRMAELRYEACKNHLKCTNAIYVIVMVLVVLGFFCAFYEMVFVSERIRKAGGRRKPSPESNQSPEPNQSADQGVMEFSVSASQLAFRSKLVGLSIFGMTFLFFLAYLVFVYPVHSVTAK